MSDLVQLNSTSNSLETNFEDFFCSSDKSLKLNAFAENLLHYFSIADFENCKRLSSRIYNVLLNDEKDFYEKRISVPLKIYFEKIGIKIPNENVKILFKSCCDALLNTRWNNDLSNDVKNTNVYIKEYGVNWICYPQEYNKLFYSTAKMIDMQEGLDKEKISMLQSNLQSCLKTRKNGFKWDLQNQFSSKILNDLVGFILAGDVEHALNIFEKHPEGLSCDELLLYTARSGRINMMINFMTLLLEQKKTFSLCHSGETVLNVAICSGSIELIKWLI